jgi:hypothetical protein
MTARPLNGQAGRPAPSLVKTVRRQMACKRDLAVAWARRGMRLERALFYPDRPGRDTVMYQVCHLLGYRISNDPAAPASFAVAWQDRTFRPANPDLDRLSDRLAVLNLRCTDISKGTLEAVHTEVFGYGLAIDPRSYDGLYVRKSNENARHDGQVAAYPVDALEDGVVYQRLVDNRIGQRLVQDIRVLVYGDALPLCYLKTRPIETRFSNRNSWVTMAQPSELVSPREQRLIVRLCRRLGMDVGEVDALRDRGTGLLYVVDANPTPAGPPNGLPRRDARLALRAMAGSLAALLADVSRGQAVALAAGGEPVPGS